jgi:hypothetical protein
MCDASSIARRMSSPICCRLLFQISSSTFYAPPSDSPHTTGFLRYSLTGRAKPILKTATLTASRYGAHSFAKPAYVSKSSFSTKQPKNQRGYGALQAANSVEADLRLTGLVTRLPRLNRSCSPWIYHRLIWDRRGQWLTIMMNRINPALFSACSTSWVRACWPRSGRPRRQSPLTWIRSRAAPCRFARHNANCRWLAFNRPAPAREKKTR